MPSSPPTSRIEARHGEHAVPEPDRLPRMVGRHLGERPRPAAVRHGHRVEVDLGEGGIGVDDVGPVRDRIDRQAGCAELVGRTPRPRRGGDRARSSGRHRSRGSSTSRAGPLRVRPPEDEDDAVSACWPRPGPTALVERALPEDLTACPHRCPTKVPEPGYRRRDEQPLRQPGDRVRVSVAATDLHAARGPHRREPDEAHRCCRRCRTAASQVPSGDRETSMKPAGRPRAAAGDGPERDRVGAEDVVREAARRCCEDGLPRRRVAGGRLRRDRKREEHRHAEEQAFHRSTCIRALCPRMPARCNTRASPRHLRT